MKERAQTASSAVASAEAVRTQRVAAYGDRDLGDSFEVLGLRGDDHVDVLGAPDHPPGVQGEAADYNELDLRPGQAAQ